MSPAIAVPVRIEESDTRATLDDVLGTLKTVYTTTACHACGRMVSLTELTTPPVHDSVLV